MQDLSHRTFAKHNKMEKIVVLLAIVSATGVAQNVITQEKAIGPEVVEEVVTIIQQACIVSQDYLLLRRLAYVESRDGSDPRTFRPGFYGGIWQVTEAMYLTTKTSPDLQVAINRISQVEGINWASTVWQDLLKPLYSGLAAALFIAHSFPNGNLPAAFTEQEEFWRTHYTTTPSISFSDLNQVFRPGCTSQADFDLAFILDTSSSISTEDFEKAKSFITSVVSAFDIASGRVYVAVVTYSSQAKVAINWHQFRTPAELSSALGPLTYESGETETDDALDLARTLLFTNSRPTAVKVAVLITDGKSQDTIDTTSAANKLKASGGGVIIMVLGVTNQVDEAEMQKIASDPTCTHAFRVAAYSQIDAIKQVIQTTTCRAPLILPMGSTTHCTFGSCPPYAIPVTSQGGVVRVQSTCSIPAQMYSSYFNSYPTSISSSASVTVTSSTTTDLRIPAPAVGQTYYYVNMNQAGAARISPCTITLTAIQHVVKVVCYENDVERQCTRTHLNEVFPSLCP